MPIDILHLPLNANKFIQRFTGSSSLLRLREVSKSTKELVDFSHLRFCNTLASSLEILNTGQQNTIRFAFRFIFENPSASNRRDYCAFKSCFIVAIQKFNIEQYQLHELKKSLIAIVSATELAQLFEFFKPLTQALEIEELYMSSYDMPHVIDMCSLFVGKKTIPMVQIENRPSLDIDYTPYLQIVNHVKPQFIRFTTSFFPREAFDFILVLASQVQSIWLSMGDTDKVNVLSQSQLTIFAIIREILVRKCEKLKIVILSRNSEFTVVDSENLLEFLHHNTEKKLSLCLVHYPSEPIDIQAGFYKVLCTRYRRFTIKNLEFPEQM